jgi:hypothetical protein
MIISGQELVIGQKPKEEMHPLGNFDGPHAGNMDREDSSKIDDFVEVLRGISSM